MSVSHFPAASSFCVCTTQSAHFEAEILLQQAIETDLEDIDTSSGSSSNNNNHSQHLHYPPTCRPMISRVVLPEPPPPSCANWNGNQVAASPALQPKPVRPPAKQKQGHLRPERRRGPGEFIEATDKLATLFCCCFAGAIRASGHGPMASVSSPAIAPWPRVMVRAREGKQFLPPEQIGVEASQRESSAGLRLLTTETKDGTSCISPSHHPHKTTETPPPTQQSLCPNSNRIP
nr:unnamed protein product [Digitaria exilis]